MEYTEEVIKEADSVLKLYTPKDAAGFDTLPRRVSIRFAIQDRQSVLKEAEQAFKTSGVFHSQYWLNRIHSLTQQIEYLKSKL